jgi:hyperosmotically inducible periplasmic protein
MNVETNVQTSFYRDVGCASEPGGHVREAHMKSTSKLKVIVPALAFGLFAAAPIFAQQNDGSGGQSMHRAEGSAESAASGAGHAIERAYHDTVTAVSDTAITAKVKAALHENKATSAADIHVKTTSGVVTLQGTVPSSEVSATALQVVQQTSGVNEVRNELTMLPTATR